MVQVFGSVRVSQSIRDDQRSAHPAPKKRSTRSSAVSLSLSLPFKSLSLTATEESLHGEQPYNNVIIVVII